MQSGQIALVRKNSEKQMEYMLRYNFRVSSNATQGWKMFTIKLHLIVSENYMKNEENTSFLKVKSKHKV